MVPSVSPESARLDYASQQLDLSAALSGSGRLEEAVAAAREGVDALRDLARFNGSYAVTSNRNATRPVHTLFARTRLSSHV